MTYLTFKDTEAEWTGPFFFIQAADTQLGLIERYLEKREDPKWDQEVVLLKKAIACANRMQPKPKFFIVCGDLVDAFIELDKRDGQIKDFKEAFKDLDNQIPLVCVCGNHDVGDIPTPESVAFYRSTYGADYFTFVVSNVLMVVLNSQYYENRSLVEEIAKQQDEWLDDVLDKSQDKYKHIILFQHIPWFLNEPEEEKEYFNIEKELRLKMLNKFYDAGIRTIFSGHYHRNAGGFFKDLELIVTSAVGAQLGDDKSGARIVKVFDDAIHHEYFALEDLPSSISLLK